MEDLLATNLRSGEPTNFANAFKGVVQLLRKRDISHVLIGTLALNTYVRPRFTDQIQIVCDYAAMDQLVGELRQIAEENAFSGSISALAPELPAMANALKSRVTTSIFETPAVFPSALALCWIFLETDNLCSQVDAGSLIASRAMASNDLKSLLEQHGSDAAFIRFDEIKRNVELGRYEGTYSDLGQHRRQRYLKGTKAK